MPLTAGDYDLSVAATLTLSAMVLAILHVHHGWSIVPGDRRGAAASGVVVGLVNGASSSLLGIDSLIVDARHRPRSSRASSSGSATRRRSAASPTTLINWSSSNRFLGIPLEFYYGIALRP